MSESSKSKQTSANCDERGAERQWSGDPTAPAPAEQFGATEQQVTPVMPPTSEKPAKKLPPDASTKQKAAEQVDPADEITPG